MTVTPEAADGRKYQGRPGVSMTPVLGPWATPPLTTAPRGVHAAAGFARRLSEQDSTSKLSHGWWDGAQAVIAAALVSKTRKARSRPEGSGFAWTPPWAGRGVARFVARPTPAQSGPRVAAGPAARTRQDIEPKRSPHQL